MGFVKILINALGVTKDIILNSSEIDLKFKMAKSDLISLTLKTYLPILFIAMLSSFLLILAVEPFSIRDSFGQVLYLYVLFGILLTQPPKVGPYYKLVFGLLL
jgi:hypothetical protein